MTGKTTIGIGIASSLIFLLLLSLSIDVESAFQELLLFNKWLLFLILINYLLAMFIRAKRWQLLLMHDSDIGLLSTFKYLSIGYFFNIILPAKGGELIRAEYLKREMSVNRSFTYGTIIIERLFDFVVVILFLALSVILSDTVKTLFSEYYPSFIVLVLLIFLMGYLLMKGNLAECMVKRLPVNIAVQFREKIDSFRSAFAVIKKKRVAGKLLYLTLLIWVLTLFTVFIVIYGLSIDIPYYAYFFIVSAGVLGMVIPSTSANIGVYHAVATGSLLVFGGPSGIALTFAIIVHAMDFIPNVTLGSYFYFNIIKTY